MHRIREMRKKHAYRWTFAVLAGVVAMVIALWDLEAEGAVLANCPEIILTTEGKSTATVDPGPVVFSVSDISTCEPGAVKDWRWDERNKTYVVLVEPDVELIKEGFE